MANASFIKNSLLLLTGVVAGIMIGVGIPSTAQDPADQDTYTSDTVTIPTAKTMIKAYLSENTSKPGFFRSFTLNRGQFDAMVKIAGANKEMTGLRLYPALDKDGKPSAIIIGLDRLGKEDTVRPFYMVQGVNSGPCPVFCDESSTFAKP